MSRPALQQLAPPFCSLSHHWTTFDLKNDSCPAAHLTALATPLQRWVSLRTDAHFMSSTLGCSCYQWMQKISSTGQVGDSPCFDRMHNTIFFEPWMLTQWQHKAGFAHEKARHAAGSAHRQTDTHTHPSRKRKGLRRQREPLPAMPPQKIDWLIVQPWKAHLTEQKKKINLSDGARCRTNHEPLLSTADETKIVSEK